LDAGADTSAFAVILSSPGDMTGMFLSLYRGPLPPFAWRSWCPRSVHRLLAASPCHGLSPSPRPLSQSDCPWVFRFSLLCSWSNPPSLACPRGLSLVRLPSVARLRWVRTPAAAQQPRHRGCRDAAVPAGDGGSAASRSFSCGALSPVHCCSGLRAPCLRFAGHGTVPDARLGT